MPNQEIGRIDLELFGCHIHGFLAFTMIKLPGHGQFVTLFNIRLERTGWLPNSKIPSDPSVSRPDEWGKIGSQENS